MKTKLQKDVVEEFIRWTVLRLETDKANTKTKRVRDKANERLWAIKLLCEQAGVGEILEKVQDGRRL